MIDNREGLKPTHLNGYDIEKCIGKGHSSLCYLAKKRSNGSSYILKEFYPIRFQDSLVRHQNNLVFKHPDHLLDELELKKSRQLFLSEIERSRSLRDFSRNPQTNGNNPYFFSADDVFEVDGSCALYVGYLTQRGDTLSHDFIHRKDRVLSLNAFLNYAKLLAYALNEMHQAGYIHLDIKPDNIFVVDYETPILKMIDLGSALRMDQLTLEDLNYSSAIQFLSLSQNYSSPKIRKIIQRYKELESLRDWLSLDDIHTKEQEIIQNVAQINFSDDIYSFFVILYEMLTQAFNQDVFSTTTLLESSLLLSVEDNLKNALVSFILDGLHNTKDDLQFEKIIEQLSAFTQSLHDDSLHPNVYLDRLRQQVQEFSKAILQTRLKDFDEDLIPKMGLEANRFDQKSTHSNYETLIERLWNRTYPYWNAQLLAEGGHGKTTFAYYLLSHVNPNFNDDLPIPLYIPLKLFNSLSADEKELDQFIYGYVIKNYLSQTTLSFEVWQRLLNHKNHFNVPQFIFILDGVNEVVIDEFNVHLKREIDFLVSHPSVQVILLSRKIDSHYFQDMVESSTLHFEKFSKERIITYLTKLNLNSQIDEHLFEILQLPLYVLMYAKSSHAVIEHNLLNHPFYEFIKNPKTEIELFKNYLEYNLYQSMSSNSNSVNQELVQFVFRTLLPFLGYQLEKFHEFSCQPIFIHQLISLSLLEQKTNFGKKYRPIFLRTMIINAVQPTFSSAIKISTSTIQKLFAFFLYFKYQTLKFLYSYKAKKYNKFVDQITQILAQTHLIYAQTNRPNYDLEHESYRDMLSALWIYEEIKYHIHSPLGPVSLLTLSSRMLPRNVLYHLSCLDCALQQVSPLKPSYLLQELLNKSRLETFSLENPVSDYIDSLKESVFDLDDVASLVIDYSLENKNPQYQERIYSILSNLDRYFFHILRLNNPQTSQFAFNHQIDIFHIKTITEMWFGHSAILNANIIRALNFSYGSLYGEDLSNLDLTRINLTELNFNPLPNQVKGITHFDHSKIYLDQQMKSSLIHLPSRFHPLNYLISKKTSYFYLCTHDTVLAYRLIDNTLAWVYKIKDYRPHMEIVAFELNLDESKIILASQLDIIVLNAYRGDVMVHLLSILRLLDRAPKDEHAKFGNLVLYARNDDFMVSNNNSKFGIFTFDYQGSLKSIDKQKNLDQTYKDRNRKSTYQDRMLSIQSNYVSEHRAYSKDEKGHYLFDCGRLSTQTKLFSENRHPIEKVYYSENQLWVVAKTQNSLLVYDYKSTRKVAEIEFHYHEIKEMMYVDHGQAILTLLDNKDLYLSNSNHTSLKALTTSIDTLRVACIFALDTSLFLYDFAKRCVIQCHLKTLQTTVLIEGLKLNTHFFSSDQKTLFLVEIEDEQRSFKKLSPQSTHFETMVNIPIQPFYRQNYDFEGTNYLRHHELCAYVDSEFICISLSFKHTYRLPRSLSIDECQIVHYDESGYLLRSSVLLDIELYPSHIKNCHLYSSKHTTLRCLYYPKNHSLFLYGDKILGILELSLKDHSLLQTFHCEHVLDIMIQEDSTIKFIIIHPQFEDYQKTLTEANFQAYVDENTRELKRLLSTYPSTSFQLNSWQFNDYKIYNASFIDVIPTPSEETQVSLKRFNNSF